MSDRVSVGADPGDTDLPADALEILSGELRRIIGRTLHTEQLLRLLGLKPLSAQSVNRFFQTRTVIQLKKGQADGTLQAINRARSVRGRQLPGTLEPATSLREAPVPSCNVDPDLPGLATPQGRDLAKVLRDVLRETHFDQVNRELRLRRDGGDYEIRPFPLPISPVDTQAMKNRLREMVKTSRTLDEVRLARRIQEAFTFFMFGESLHRKALEELFGEERKAILNTGAHLGLFINAEGQAMRMNGLSLFSRELRNGDVIYVLADTPPHFDTRAAHQRVYIGADSYELVDRVSQMSRISGYCVEMGSGSGIQIIAALKQRPAITKAIGKERDRRAIHVSLFNAALNGVEERMVVVDDNRDLKEATEGHPVVLAISNPPFIAMPAWIDIDPEDRPVLSTLMEVRETDRGLQGDLRTAYPEAGWGGEDGLAVTKQFVEALLPLLAPQAQVVIYSQFAGDGQGPRVIEEYVQAVGGCHFAFDAVRSRPLLNRNPETGRVFKGQTQKVLSADEAARAVARLIVAALMAKQDPRRPRVMVRTGGPEHALLLKCARRIEESYRSQGITHFHDGFVILTKQNANGAV
jgi:methylase of polypeptide subunit release factors